MTSSVKLRLTPSPEWKALDRKRVEHWNFQAVSFRAGKLHPAKLTERCETGGRLCLTDEVDRSISSALPEAFCLPYGHGDESLLCRS